MRMRNILFIAAFTFLLTGCQNSFIEKSKETVQKTEDPEQHKDLSTMYEKIKKPAKKALDENEKEKVGINKDQIKIKDKYEDPAELAVFISKAIFDYEREELTPSEYFKVLQTYASRGYLSKLPKEAKEAIFVLEQVQDQLNKQKSYPFNDYEITSLSFNKMKTEAYFYRKESNNNSTEAKYNITTLKKIKDYWYYDQDNLSVDYIVDEALEREE